VDRFRVVTLPEDGRAPAVELELIQAGQLEREKDTFAIAPGARSTRRAAQGGRYGGARPLGETHEDGAISWTALVKGDTAAESIVTARYLLRSLEEARGRRYLEWKPSNAPWPVYFELRGPGSWRPLYSSLVFEQVRFWRFEVSLPIAPLALGSRMDVVEDWRRGDGSDPLADGTFDAGAAADFTITAGELVPGSTAEKRLYHSSRGYAYRDAQVTLAWIAGAAVTGERGLILRRVSATRYLLGRDNGGTLQIVKVDGGAETVLASVAAPAFVVGGRRWLRFRAEGNVLTLEASNTEPVPITLTTQIVHQLSAADAALLGETIGGGAGLRTLNVPVDWRFGEVRIEPYVYRRRMLADLIRLPGIPGDADALVDLELSTATAIPFALLGWHGGPPPHNLVTNGGFEDDAEGWGVAALTNINAAATSINRVTTASKFGVASGEAVTPATTDSGPNFTLYRYFRRGVTYTASAWVRAAASTTGMRIRLGSAGTTDLATGATVALTSGWVKHSVTWTPTADRWNATVALITAAATATTFQIDGVDVYEGTVEPTLGEHAEGNGGFSPFGLLEAANDDPGLRSGWAIASDGGARSGNVLRLTGIAGAGSVAAGWIVDPALLTPDEFRAGGEVEVEVWARMQVYGVPIIAPRLTVSARPQAGTAFGAERFTAEYGAAGRLLADVTAANAWRWRRLGTLTLVVDRANPTRWIIRAAVSYATGTLSGGVALDYLALTPTRARLASPAALINDAAYPDFIGTSAETTKLIRTDRTGAVAKPPGGYFPDHGLSGSRLELPVGDVDLLAAPRTQIPDDPSEPASENLNVETTVHARITPRYLIARDS
jgi:hypothetical protein